MKFRRRVYLIDRRLQLRFTMLVVALILVYSVFLGGATYLNYRISSIAFDTTAIYSVDVEEAIKAEGRRTVVTTIGFLVVNGIVVGLVFILLTHKVAGPLYRMRMHIGEIRDGKIPSKMRLRKDDELSGLAGALNEMTATLRATCERESKELSELAVRLRELVVKFRESGGGAEDDLKCLENCAEAVASMGAVRQEQLGSTFAEG